MEFWVGEQGFFGTIIKWRTVVFQPHVIIFDEVSGDHLHDENRVESARTVAKRLSAWFCDAKYIRGR